MKILTICCALALAVPACAPVYSALSPTQLAERGTHRYPGVTREKAVDACAMALSTLNYRVTVKQSETGLVKSAPAAIMTSATGGRNYATVSEDGLAWSIVVETAGNDVIVRATPRGFRNGSEVHDEGMWVAEVMDAKFRDLWREVDENLGAGKVAK
jgi:hypothetical protein